MKGIYSNKTKKVRNLIVICAFSVIVLTVATYAWFIGLQTVEVASFNVEIAATESLLLSLNGEDWSETININSTNIDDVSYEGHSNNWSESGLVPMSSIGEIDPVYSRMRLFEKASLTNTPGGFRLMASRVQNYGGQSEQEGYVVFDLFIKNFSGTQYIEELNILNEEGIYLTTDSNVSISAAGVEETGIENSVRLGFAQIGRVIGSSTDANLITSITCTTGGGVTGICRDAEIWEPNDLAHEANAISWYETICRSRTGADVRDPSSYDGPCETLEDGIYYPTYAVNDVITSADNVNVYDGAAFNGYENTTLLSEVTTFTDTMKNIAGNERPEFMKLAPNSITKLRIYIWIEGQDIDNYDYAALGQEISVNFGFTKQKLTEEDFNYVEPTP